MRPGSLDEPERSSTSESGVSARERARQLREEAARLREAGRTLGAEIQQQLQKRPLVVLGAVAGVGFLAGSLFGSRLGQLLLAAGAGYALKDAVKGGVDMDGIRAGLDRLAGTSD